MDDVAPRANLHRFLCAQTCPRRPLIRVIVQQATMASQNDDVLGLSGDNGAGNVDAYIQRELITFGQETVQHSLHAASQSQTGTSGNTTTMEISISPPSRPENVAQQEAPSAPAVAVVVTKVSRKSTARGKQHLLAAKDFYLKHEFSSVFEDEGPLLQGYVSECPNKNSNQSRCRIDWQKTTALPPPLTLEMLSE